ncbi:SLAM family member 5-like isoform X3 [Parambassis ranga]|uniref:SLAM family member 5-like isoform X3 n=1 Tax=Parambassis ranga TaxID=210632 RepID=A0A6P7JTX4_9TELE|nr:SLAM family member 5-like isoform X3 [Parambassis ranga]
MTQQFSSSLALSLLVFVTCSEAALTVKVGDQVVLKPGPVTGDITDIMWKHNEDIVLEWDGAEVTYYKQHLKGRCELNNRTAELKILSLTLEDSGSYTAEVNRMVQSPTEVLVLASVPKPTVSETCDPQEDYCTLSCDGNTTGTGPVTYTWMSGDTEVSSTKDYILTKDAKEPSFHCVLNNTVSSQSSEEFHNRFIGNYQMLWLLVLVPILFVLGIVFYKWKTNTGTKTWGPGTSAETKVL